MIIWQVVSVTAKNVEGRSLPCQFDNFTALRQVSEKCARFASMFCQACFWQNIFLFWKRISTLLELLIWGDHTYLDYLSWRSPIRSTQGGILTVFYGDSKFLKQLVRETAVKAKNSLWVKLDPIPAVKPLLAINFYWQNFRGITARNCDKTATEKLRREKEKNISLCDHTFIFNATRHTF